MWKTRIAWALFCLAITFLTAVAVVIVVKLIFFPPCTQEGNTCVIDPWSAAGLEASILGVAATVLAILGAAAVAGWWASLNNRVNDQIKILYSKHKKEIGKKLDDFITLQQHDISDGVGKLQSSIGTAERRINMASTEIDELEKLTYNFFDVAIDGIVLALPGSLETWAQKVVALHKFPRVPLKMAERYLDAVESGITSAIEEVLHEKEQLSASFRLFASLIKTSDSDSEQQRVNIQRVGYIGNDCRIWLDKDAEGKCQAADILICWCSVLRWRDVAVSENANTEALERLDTKINAYRFQIEQLSLGHEQLKKETKRLLVMADRYLQGISVMTDSSEATK